MGGGVMRSFLAHYRIQLMRLSRQPFTLAVLIFCGVASLFFWPGLCDPDDPAGIVGNLVEDIDARGILFLWLITLSMMAGILLSGPISAGPRAELFSVRACPALPVGPKTRIAAEGLIIFTFIIAARGVVFLLGEEVRLAVPLPGLATEGAGFRAPFAADTAWGCLLILPFVLSWVAPAATTVYYISRPILLGCLFWVALELGYLAAPLLLLTTSLALCFATLQTAGREPTIRMLRKRSAGPPVLRFRTCRSPESQLRRDMWLGPLPAAAALIGLEAVFLVLNQIVTLPRFGFYILSSLVFGFIFSMVILRPMGSQVIAMGLSSMSNIYDPGDYCAAWSVLPVRREAVTRGIYLHGLISGTAAWLLVLAVNLVNTWLKTGEVFFSDTEGDPAGKFFLPMIALVPCMAGGLTCASVGDRLKGILSLGAAIAVFVIHFGCIMTRAPMTFQISLLAAVAVVGGIPPLVHLRAPQGVNDGPMAGS